MIHSYLNTFILLYFNWSNLHMSINHMIWSIFEAIWGVSQTTWAIKYELFVKKKPFRSLIFINLRFGIRRLGSHWDDSSRPYSTSVLLSLPWENFQNFFDQAPGLINAVMAFLLKNVWPYDAISYLKWLRHSRYSDDITNLSIWHILHCTWHELWHILCHIIILPVETCSQVI